jgi:transcriptional regulator with GAF, ATPase, and Fis domain
VNPYLVALTGPLKGKGFDLCDGDLTIGREDSNKLYFSDPKVSRHHATIEQHDGVFTLTDQDSTNGTFVNGLPIHQHSLEHGDQIQIGASSFLFVLRDPDTPSDSVAFDSDPATLVGRPVLQLRPEDSIYLSPTNRISPALVDRMSGDLKVLLHICTELTAARNLKDLQQKLLEMTFEAVPGDAGAILLFDGGTELPTSSFTFSHQQEPGRVVEVSRNVVRKVMTDRVAVLSHPANSQDAAAQQPSLIRRGVQSVLCVPLFVLDRIIGVIYVESSTPGFRFDERHLQFVLAVAGMAGLALDNMQQLEWLQSENRRLKNDFNLEHAMIGESARMKEIYRFIAKVAHSDSTVLILGESGTGKELVARAIHTNSSRSEKPFLAINCAALTETLLESELFGHEKGAFTGAMSQKKGKLEVADGGTLFLDEVGELAGGIQAKLLRVLQERQFERVGGTRPIKVDIRLVTATNRDLESSIAGGTFRQDLYYRLNVVSVTMPPLRERREDIPLLARYFAAQCSKKSGKPVAAISPEVRQCLMSYDWPGNVRELENAMERAVVMGTTEMIVLEDLPETLLEKNPTRSFEGTKFHLGVRDAKRQLILNALSQTGGNYTQAAKLLGLHPNNLHRLIRNLDLKSSL